MKKYSPIVVALLTAVTAYSQPGPAPAPVPPRTFPTRPLHVPGMPPPAMDSEAPAREPVNYLIRVEWKAPKTDSKFLEVLTSEGHFELDTIEKNPVKIDGNEIPTTLKFNGTVVPVGDDKARLQLFLGRTVPYVTGATVGGPGSSRSSYQQISVGLSSSFIVKFGKPVVIQNDENGQISVLVKRMDD